APPGLPDYHDGLLRQAESAPDGGHAANRRRFVRCVTAPRDVEGVGVRREARDDLDALVAGDNVVFVSDGDGSAEPAKLAGKLRRGGPGHFLLLGDVTDVFIGTRCERPRTAGVR